MDCAFVGLLGFRISLEGSEKVCEVESGAVIHRIYFESAAIVLLGEGGFLHLLANSAQHSVRGPAVGIELNGSLKQFASLLKVRLLLDQRKVEEGLLVFGVECNSFFKGGSCTVSVVQVGTDCAQSCPDSWGASATAAIR